PRAPPRSTCSSTRSGSPRARPHDPHDLRPAREQARRARPRVPDVRAPRLQHREPRGRADRAPRRVADHAARRLHRRLARADSEADAQARERPARPRPRAGRGGRARACARHGDGAAGAAGRVARARGGLPRADRRRRPRRGRLRGRRRAGRARHLRGARPTARHPRARANRQDRARARVLEDAGAPTATRPPLKGAPSMATVHREGDLDLLSGKVAVMGWGSQAHAHALNLHDSGVEVEVGLRDGSPSRAKAEEAGVTVRTLADATRGAQIVAMLLPDQVQPSVYDEHVAPNLADGAALLFAHGFNVHYGRIQPPAGHDVIMVAPKGPGHIVRRIFTEGYGTPALVAVAQDASGQARDLALAYAAGIGATRA